MNAFEGRFEGFSEELEEAIAEAVGGEKSNGKMTDTQQKAIKQRVMSIVERRLDADPGEETGAAKAAGATGSSGRGRQFVSSEDRAAALTGGLAGGTADNGGGSVGLSKSGETVSDALRRARVLLGKVEPKNAQERYLASLEGKRRKQAIEGLEKQLPDEDGVTDRKAAAIKRAGDKAAEERRQKVSRLQKGLAEDTY